MRRKRIMTMLVAFCALMAVAVGGAASMPVAAPDAPAVATGGGSTSAPVATMSGPTVAATDRPAAATEATNSSTGQVNDCDLIDVDGDDNTVSANLTSNATGGENGEVSVRIRCEAGNATDTDFVDIDGDNNTVTLAVRAENGTLLLGGSDGENDDAGLDIASQCEGGTLADCDVVDIDGDNNTVNIIVESNGGRTVYEFGSGSGHATAQSSEPRSATENVSYYQVDFVAGDPIENLRGPEGYYTPDRLIRFAHGSTTTPVMRRSDGEFTTDHSLAGRIESQNITVEDHTATTTFTVANDSAPLTLTLASYRKVGPDWNPRTEAEQEFVDSETHTVGPGTHTLRVGLPTENASVATASDGTRTDGDNGGS